MLPAYKPHRCARATAHVAGDASGYQAIGLFNNSTGAHVLVVRALDVVGGGADIPGTYTLHGPLSTLVGPGTPVVADQATPAGLIYSDLLAAHATIDWDSEEANNFIATWPHEYPFAVLPPGWSLVAINGAADSSVFRANFFWQQCSADELID